VFARVTSYEGTAAGFDEGVRIYAEQVVPWLKETTGFRGVLILLDREAGKALGVTLWNSEEDERASYETVSRFRGTVAETVGSTPGPVEGYEVALLDGVID
jgi:hypothetical protein